VRHGWHWRFVGKYLYLHKMQTQVMLPVGAKAQEVITQLGNFKYVRNRELCFIQQHEDFHHRKGLSFFSFKPTSKGNTWL
jgi:hypothetical protein